eukprot:gene2367-2672_t
MTCQTAKPLTPIKSRGHIGLLLQEEGLKIGAELGVQAGQFASETLQSWHNCTRYYLIDTWAPQSNYKDYANVPQERHDEFMAQAMLQLKPYKAKTVWMKTTTAAAAKLIPEPLDYVYVDARHDYCGVLEDIQTYWPLIRPGGIMAGHDYENAPDVMQQSGQDWSLCANGTIHQGSVQAAVNEFFSSQGSQVVVTYREAAWNSWMPLSQEEQASFDGGKEMPCCLGASGAGTGGGKLLGLVAWRPKSNSGEPVDIAGMVAAQTIAEV